MTHHLYISDPVHKAVLTDAHAVGQVHLGYGPDAACYDQIKHLVDAVLLRAERFDAHRLLTSPRLKIVARHGSGTDNVDLRAATNARIWVTRTPGANSRAVAEHTFALLLAVTRRMRIGFKLLETTSWGAAKEHMHGDQLHGRTLGLVGFGSIAQLVAPIATGFGMKAMVHDPFLNREAIEQQGYEYAVDMSTLLSRSDVVSLHAPLTEGTHHMLAAAAFASMRPGAILINTSRAGLIDEAALINSLRSGHLGGAALDVVSGEALDPLDPLAHSDLPLHDLPQLVITPHVGGQTDQAYLQAGLGALHSIRQVLNGDIPDDAVNTIPTQH